MDVRGELELRCMSVFLGCLGRVAGVCQKTDKLLLHRSPVFFKPESGISKDHMKDRDDAKAVCQTYVGK